MVTYFLYALLIHEKLHYTSIFIRFNIFLIRILTRLLIIYKRLKKFNLIFKLLVTLSKAYFQKINVFYLDYD